MSSPNHSYASQLPSSAYHPSSPAQSYTSEFSYSKPSFSSEYSHSHSHSHSSQLPSSAFTSPSDPYYSFKPHSSSDEYAQQTYSSQLPSSAYSSDYHTPTPSYSDEYSHQSYSSQLPSSAYSNSKPSSYVDEYSREAKEEKKSKKDKKDKKDKKEKKSKKESDSEDEAPKKEKKDKDKKKKKEEKKSKKGETKDEMEEKTEYSNSKPSSFSYVDEFSPKQSYSSQFPSSAYSSQSTSNSPQLPSYSPSQAYASQLPSTAYQHSQPASSRYSPHSSPQMHTSQVASKPYNNLPSSYPPSNSPKRAVVVGICYFNDRQARLNGSLDDARTMKKMLISKFGFNERDILVLLDVPNCDQAHRPTRANIISALKWLTYQSKPGDNLFFFYSGHGSQTEDLNGDETDGMDETLMPEDYATAGSILDDELYEILAAPLPRNAKLTCFFDCCHSGTGLDLPYVYSGGRLTQERMAKNDTKGDVVLLSGCADDQTSKDGRKRNTKTLAFSGVMTSAFCQAMETTNHMSYNALIQSMRRFCSNNGSFQCIQLSSGKPFDVNDAFTL